MKKVELIIFMSNYVKHCYNMQKNDVEKMKKRRYYIDGNVKIC